MHGLNMWEKMLEQPKSLTPLPAEPGRRSESKREKKIACVFVPVVAITFPGNHASFATSFAGTE